MAQEQSVQGAAEKISGLLNPKQDNQVPEKKEAAPSEQPEKIKQESCIHKSFIFSERGDTKV